MKKIALFFVGVGALALCSCMHRHSNDTLVFRDLAKLPEVKPLWGRCYEVPKEAKGELIRYKVAGNWYQMGALLGAGGGGEVYELKADSPEAIPLVLKIPFKADADTIYEDILIHSTLEILGIPTTKAGIAYITDKEGKKKYLLFKERVMGTTLSEENSKGKNISLPFSPKKQESEGEMRQVARIVSRMVNSKVWVQDLHLDNFMVVEATQQVVVVDAQIYRSFVDGTDPHRNFGLAIGLRSPIGDNIFYDRYYFKDEPAAPESAVKIAKERVELYFTSKALPCEKNAEGRGFPVDVDTIFAQPSV